MKVELTPRDMGRDIEPNVKKELNSRPDYQNYQKKNTQKTGQAGFVLDIGGMHPADGLMGAPELKTADELMQEIGSTDAALQKDMMTVVSSTMSKEDYAEFLKNGGSLSDMTPEEQVTSLDRLKAKLLESGTVIKGYNDDLSKEELQAITGSMPLAGKIEDALKANDLPVSEENVKSMVSGFEKASQIKPPSEDAIRYMIENEKAPSEDALYKAEHSAGNRASGQRQQGYYEEQGYLQKGAGPLEWDAIKEQAERIVRNAGFSADEKTMAEAEWLVGQGIPLTGENLERLNALRELSFPLDTDKLLTSMAVGIADGQSPDRARLYSSETIIQKALSLKEETDRISDEALRKTVEAGKTLNLRNLFRAQNEITAVSENAAAQTENQTQSLISARRQLEETRLAMSFEANLRLLRQGVSLDLAPLSELVDRLKQAERDYFAPLLTNERDGAEAEDNKAVKNGILDERIGLYRETVTVFEALKKAPAETLARINTKGPDFTPSGVLRTSVPVAERIQKAGDTYEALMTAPRADLGDSIRKAFGNIDDILADNGYELSAVNRRAVRILGYAEMRIDPEAIDRVKEADQALNTVLEAMTPERVLRMIRNGDNPMDENIFSLQERLREKEPSESMGQYARFLVKLEKKGGITEDEKQAYIGMYRLFRQIEKSDGKLLGNVLDSGEKLTLRNLLSASRSNRAKGMDYGIDDDFGALEQVLSKGNAIDEQIDTGFRQASQAYYEDLSGNILEKLSAAIVPKEALKPDTTPEALYEALREQEVPEEDVLSDYGMEAGLLRNARQTEEAVINALRESGIPVTPNNVLAEEALRHDRSGAGVYVRLIRAAGNRPLSRGEEARRERLEKAVRELNESLDSYENAGEAYVALK
ncbi:MAG: DUF6240 domain-containing protein, partial [Lachnospiraceae bacterium]|nr:DUF6240 domain-containing protein [Lachnospiraceae bacterium]